MFKATVTTIICFLIALVGAQTFDEETSSIILLQMKAVQREIGVTEAQRVAMNKFADAHRSRLNQYYQQLQARKNGSNPDEGKLIGMFAELKNAVLKQLTPAQLKRLREVSLQALDFGALADHAVGQRVGLSNAQQERIRSLMDSGLKEANQVRENAMMKATAELRNSKPKSDAERRKVYDEANRRAEAAAETVAPQVGLIRADTKKKILAILTPKQKAAWQALLGKPFHLPKP
jgi:hypothetical protein